MSKKKQETIFVPGLNRHVPVDQIANINPDVDIRDATHFVSIHLTDDIDYNKETEKFTKHSSPGHNSIEFIARGEVEGHFGKHPIRRGMPIDITEIKDDSERYRDGKDYDKVYGTNTVLTKILPVTEEQYRSSFTDARQRKESSDIYNLVSGNCNVFVNDVIQATGIPNINISKLYTGEELKNYGKLVATNILANHGACDTSFTVSESIHTNVADKYKVPEDRILTHPVDPSNPDVRFHTIFPEGVCPPKVEVGNVIPTNIRIPFLIEPPLKKQFIDILPKLYPKDYPVKFENWPSDIWGKQVIDRNDFEAIKHWLPIYKGQLTKQKEFIDILPKLYPKDYPVKYEDWTSQWGKSVIDRKDFETIKSHLPIYKQQLSQKEFINILSKLYPKDYPTRFENWPSDTWGKQVIDRKDFKAIEQWLPIYKEQLAKQKEFIDILPKLYPKDYPVRFEDWTTQWGKQVVDSGNIKAIEANLPGYKQWLANKKEFVDILPKLYPEWYPIKFENWPADSWGKQVINDGNFKAIEQSLPTYRRQLAEKMALDPYATNPAEYIASLTKGIMNSNSFEQLKKQCKDAVRECLSKAQKQLAKFIADKAGEEKKYREDINAEAQSEVAAANEKCRSKCNAKKAELDAKVEAESQIKFAAVQAAHAGHIGGCGCPSVVDNNDIVAKYQPVYDNFCRQSIEERDKEIAGIEKKYQAMMDGKGESVKESIYAKQEGINEAIASLADEINKILKVVATNINTGGTVSIDSINDEIQQAITDFLEKAHGTINNVTVMSVPNIEYDNPVLNHPELVKEMANKFGSGIVDKLIDFGMQFVDNREDRELLESVCNQTDNVNTMSLLMGLDVPDGITYH